MIGTKEKKKLMLAAEYLGGYKEYGKANGMITFYETYLKFGALLKKSIEIPLSDVKSITVESPDETGKRLTATRLVALGVFAFALKKDKKECFIVVETKDNQEAIFHINGLDRRDVYAKLAPVRSQLEM